VAIYEPKLILSDADRDALVLLAQMALASQGESQGNISPDAVTLSPREAKHLLELLEQFSSSKLFLEGAYFIEGLANGKGWHDDRLRQIYFSWRVRRGRTRVASTQAWREFILRAGFYFSDNAWTWPRDLSRNPLRPMTLQHFLAMERKLISAAGLHPRVANLIVSFVEDALPALGNLRERKAAVRPGSIKSFVDRFVRDLKDHINGREKQPMTRRKVIAISTIVMDTAALFATRDWTAAGVLSSLAAVAPDALDYTPPR